MKLDQAKLVNACERMTKLMADPQPGLATWHVIAQRLAEEIGALFINKDDARALWAVRVLDAWRREEPACRWWSMGESHDYDGPVSAHGCLLEWVGGSKDYVGADENAARLAAALAVLPSLSADARAKLGECP